MGVIDAREVSGPAPAVQPSGAAPAAPTYTTGAVAKMCGISQQSVIRCFDAGRLAGFRVPGSKFRRVTRAGLFRFMVANGIDLAPLGELSAEEKAALAAKAVGPVKLADRLGEAGDVLRSA